MAKKTAPVGFSDDIAAQVGGLISEGLSLRKIEMKEGMPTKTAILSWLLQGEAYNANGEPTHSKALFLDHYARAREVQADCLADDIITIADDSQYDTALDEQGKTVVNMWKYGMGSRSVLRSASHCLAAAPWHFGQCRLRQEL